MNRKRAAHVLEVPGIDLDYRPRDYFWALDANVLLPSDISGEARWKLFRARIEAGSTVRDGLDAELLDKPLREAWGRLHPRNMGGEYLPPLRKAEVEMARISLDSTTADQGPEVNGRFRSSRDFARAFIEGSRGTVRTALDGLKQRQRLQNMRSNSTSPS